MSSYKDVDSQIHLELPEVERIGDGEGGGPGLTEPMLEPGVNYPEPDIPDVPEPTPDLVGWTTDITRGATDYRTITYSSGDILLADGTTYSVTGGSKIITGVTYFYVDIENGTVETTTTATDSVGSGKILVAVADTSPSGKLATFTAFGTNQSSGLITASQIAANTITGNEIASNTITATQINTATITALDLTSGTITGATITGGTIRTTSTGQRVELGGSGVRPNTIRFFNSSNVEVGTFRSNGNFLAVEIYDRFHISGDTSVVGELSGRSISSNGTISASGGFRAFNTSTFYDTRPNLNNTYDLGTSSYRWNFIYGRFLNISDTIFAETIRPNNNNSSDLGVSNYRRRYVYARRIYLGSSGDRYIRQSGNTLYRYNGTSNVTIA